MKKILLSTGSIYSYGLNRIFNIANRAGFDGIELLVCSRSETGYIDTLNSSYLQKLENQNAIKIVGIHAPFEIECDENPELIWSEISKLANNLNANFIVIHIPRVNQKYYLGWFDKEIKSRKNSLFKVCIENLYISSEKYNPIANSPDEFQKYQYMCLDTSHALHGDQELNKFQNNTFNVKHIHCSNWNGSIDHTSILKEKKLFKNFFKNVSDFTETITVELCPEAFEDIYDEKNITKQLTNELQFIRASINKKA